MMFSSHRCKILPRLLPVAYGTPLTENVNAQYSQLSEGSTDYLGESKPIHFRRGWGR
jgi:hypothetical protein